MAIFGADIWAWHNAGAYGSGTPKTPPKDVPLVGPNDPTAISKSSFPKKLGWTFYSKNADTACIFFSGRSLKPIIPV